MVAMMKPYGILLLLTLWIPSVFAFNIHQQEDKNPVTVQSVSVTPREVKAGDRIPVIVDIEIQKDFYVYDEKIKLFPLEPDGMTVGGMKLSPMIEFVDFAGKRHTGLKESARLDFFAEMPASLDQGLRQIVVDLEYIACTQKFCLPKIRREIKIPVNIPSAVSGAPGSMIEQQISQNLLWAFVLVFLFGFLTSLTPCVYPLIPITLAVIGARTSQSSKAQAFSLSLVYVLGIATTYSLLGVVAAKTGALFGQVLSYQPVVLGFVVLFVLMALSIYGYFEIRIPLFISRRFEKAGPSKGYPGAFTSGLIAGIVASPCVGPVLVGVLAYIAKTQNVVLGFSLLFTFAMGMGVLFLFLGTFSSFFKKLPRSGGWMDLVKFVLGTTMLGVALYYLKPLLPESWFLICLALLSFAALFIFAAKVYPKTHRRVIHQMPFVFCALVVLSPIASRWNINTEPSQLGSKAALKNGWQLYSEELISKAKADGRPVVIDFFADWCAACVELDEKTFSTPQFIEATRNVVLLKVDATENFPELADLQKKYEVYGLPTIVFINKKGEVVKDIALTGFEEIEPFMIRLQKMLE
jgi:thioredoxin:protein disulfide reductase